jgi:iron complex outermembrane receptor protein
MLNILSRFIKSTFGSFAILSVSAITLAAFQSTASAQDVAGADSANEPELIEEIIVTGSRIARDEYTLTQAVSITTQEEIRNRGFDNVAQALNDDPSFGIPGSDNVGRAGGAKFDGGEPIGQQFVNFFDLGSQRTLVVVDGKRMVTQSSPMFSDGGQQLDLNIIPSLLIERVETLAIGGAPIYGTDAIAGTVNIILKDRVDGFEYIAQSGLTQKGDAANHQFGALLGGDLANGRGSALVVAQYTKIDPLYPASTARPEAFPGARFVDGRNNNPFVPAGATLGLCPSNCGNFYFIPNGGLPATDYRFRRPPLNSTGLSVQDAAGNQLVFGPNGTLIPYDPGLIVANIYAFGGDGPNEFESVNVVGGQERFNFAGNVNYEIAEGVNFYIETLTSIQDTTDSANQPANNSAFFQFEEPATAIRLTNPFLQDPDRVTIGQNIDFNLDGLPDNNIDTDGDGVDDTPGFYLHRFHGDLENGAPSTYEQDVYSFRSGIEGDFDFGDRRVAYELAYSFGRTEVNTSGRGISDLNFILAVDAVQVDAIQASAINGALGSFGLNDVADGQIVCRAQLDAALNGLPTLPGTNLVDDDYITRRIAECVPLNLLGENAPSEAAKEYVNVNYNDSAEMEQHDVIGTVSFDAFDLPWHSDSLALALGFEVRRESSRFTAGGINELGEGRVADKRSIYGEIDTNELFAEVLFPVVTPDMDVPLMQSFDIEAAARYTDSSLAGSGVTSSIGAKWRVGDQLMFRGNYTQSARAPSAGEAFPSPRGDRQGITDPCDRNNIGTGPDPTVRRANCEILFQQFEDAELGLIDVDPQQPGAQTGIDLYKDAGATQPVIREGNPNLTNEEATAYSVGFVYTPEFLSDFSVAADWVNIEIENVISFLNATSLVTACFDDPNFQKFCDRIDRDNTFQISNARQTFGNVGYKNFAALVLSADYAGSLSDFGLKNWGDFTVAVNYQYLDKLETSVLGTGTDLNPAAGEYSNPEHETRVAINYYKGDFDVFWQTSFVGETVINLQDPQDYRSPSKVPYQAISHAGVGYQISENLRVKLIVTNLFDRYPDALESAALGATVGRGGDAPAPYDVLGRRFVVSLQGSF